MKRTTLITILFATLAVYGCSSEDGGGEAGSGGSAGSGGTAGSGGSAGMGGGAGEGGMGGSAGMGGGPVAFYEQNFNSLDIGGAEIGDGWLYFVNVFSTPPNGYGGPAPNGPQICALVTGQGGPDQEPQQLSVYSDYNNNAAQTAGDLLETNVFQEPFSQSSLLTAAEVGTTFTFSFQAKRGNINDPADVNCQAPVVCDVTANAFIKTLDPNAGFSVSGIDEVDTTDLPVEWGGFTIELDITDDQIGHILQFGFQTNATNFQPSGNFYDNVVVTQAATAP